MKLEIGKTYQRRGGGTVKIECAGTLRDGAPTVGGRSPYSCYFNSYFESDGRWVRRALLHVGVEGFDDTIDGRGGEGFDHAEDLIGEAVSILDLPELPPGIEAAPAYSALAGVLQAAHDHAANGKGKQRHDNGKSFLEQPSMEIARLVGLGYPVGQAMKKCREATGMAQRGEYKAAEAELLGAINYAAMAVIALREKG